jgi:hypothetical protein
MRLRQKRILLSIIFFVTAMGLAIVSAIILMNRPTSAPKSAKQTILQKNQDTGKPKESYTGSAVLVTDALTIKVPNGWKASIADTGNFRGIMFARPEALASLTYTAVTPAVIDRAGFPIPTRLSEHFFVLVPTASQAFTPTNHREVTSEPFTFDDNTAGTKYYVVKHSEEAEQYGGLLRDSEWQGRTYIYEKNDTRIEAHFALYPSSTIDKTFFESVVRSITVK